MVQMHNDPGWMAGAVAALVALVATMEGGTDGVHEPPDDRPHHISEPLVAVLEQMGASAHIMHEAHRAAASADAPAPDMIIESTDGCRPPGDISFRSAPHLVERAS